MSINVGRQVNLIGFHRDNTGDDVPARRFPPPWTIEGLDACFVVEGQGQWWPITFCDAGHISMQNDGCSWTGERHDEILFRTRPCRLYHRTAHQSNEIEVIHR
jgi:hypothetical protein